jgi:hypothetical protein
VGGAGKKEISPGANVAPTGNTPKGHP